MEKRWRSDGETSYFLPAKILLFSERKKICARKLKTDKSEKINAILMCY